MRSKNRQLLPEPNDRYVQVPGRQGGILFPRELADRRIDLDCAVLETSLPDLRVKARDIAAWLHTTDRAELSFDDEPGKYYRGKLALAVDFEHLATMGQFSLAFVCEPLAYGDQVTTDFVSDTANMDNAGTAPTPVIIDAEFTVVADEFIISLGDYYIRVVHDFQPGNTLHINTETALILINGSRALDKLDWHNSRFFKLAPGENNLTITPANVCTATAKYAPRWY